MEIIHRIQTDFRFNKEELKEIIIAGIILGIIFSLRAWSHATVNDFFLGTIIALTSIFFHISIQKIVGLKVGYGAEFKISWIGLGIAFAFSLLYSGWFWWLIIPGGTTFTFLAKYRLGSFRYGMNYFSLGLVAFSGSIGSILFASIFKNIQIYLPIIPISAEILNAFFVFNIVYAAISLLPIPPLDGHYLFYGSIQWYVFLAAAIILYAIMATFNVYSWIFAIILGIAVWLFYYSKYEASE